MKVLIGITGGIAAYKICSLIRMFKKAGDEVRVVMTGNALEFIGAKTLETLSENEVYTNQFAPKTSISSTGHISLADWADLFIVAPLSANTLGKFANGICDNLLTSLFCASLGKGTHMILAPAMNEGMWNNPFVQKNLSALRGAGCKIVEPEDGFLACGTTGTGRLASIEKIYKAAIEITPENAQPLKGKKILITAGGTREYIDPVRYITNSSSGKMGAALAFEAAALGADIELISTFDIEGNFEVTRVETAEQMQEAVQKAFPACDCLIMAAAVADFRPTHPSDTKIAKEQIGKDKEGGENLILELSKNPDILKNISVKKRENQTVIGFCLSTENLIENAKKKLADKKCDFIIANEAQIALGTDVSEIHIIGKKGVEATHKGTKAKLARKILELI